MYKKLICLISAVIILLSMLAACGGSKNEADKSSGANADWRFMGDSNQSVSQDTAVTNSESDTGGDGSTSYTATGDGTGNSANAKVKASADATAITTTSTAAGRSIASAILAQRKIIRNANVTVEVEDFDMSYGKLKSFLSGIGYIQESNIKKVKEYVDSKEVLVTKGVIVIRIDKGRFDFVLEGIKGLGLILDENIGSEDVTEKFFDTQSRLRLLKYEETRLEQYLKKISDPDIIFKTESRLTEIRYEIEGLTGTLQKLSELVELSTITINMNEKSPTPPPVKEKEKTYLEKLGQNFIDSFKGVIEFCGGFLILLVQILPGLILMLIIALAAFLVYRKFFKGRRKSITYETNHDSEDIQM